MPHVAPIVSPFVLSVLPPTHSLLFLSTLTDVANLYIFYNTLQCFPCFPYLIHYSLSSSHLRILTPIRHSPKMSADSPQTTPPTRSTYSFRITPAQLARLPRNSQPPTYPKRKPKTPKTTPPSCHISLQRPSHVVQPSSSPVSPSTMRSTPTNPISQPSTKETATLTRYRQPSRFTTSISAIPHLISQFLSALAGPLITPRNLTIDILRALLRTTSSFRAPTPSIYPPTPSSALTQITPSNLDILPVPLVPSSRATPHNFSTVVNSFFSYFVPTFPTYPLLPFRYFSTTTSESIQTDSYYLCPYM